MALQFTIDGQDGRARASTVSISHGSYRTPIFMPVGTKGAIKGVSTLGMEGVPIECEILLANTYHLADHPGAELLENMEGLHKFMNFTGNVLTDSGGFQMVSLLKLAEITEKGVKFASPEDGSMIMLTPEESIATQHKIGSDIIMALDDVVHSCRDDMERYEEATDRTVRWLDRCIVEHLTQKKNRYEDVKMAGSIKDENVVETDNKRKHSDLQKDKDEEKLTREEILEKGYRSKPSLFAITQGWLDCKPGGMRERCLKKFIEVDKDVSEEFLEKNKHLFLPNVKEEGYKRLDYIDGIAIGGLAGGEAKTRFIETVDYSCKNLPDEKPRYLMGVGYPEDVVVCTALGVDMFDCVYPTRTARFGTALTPYGLVKLKQARYKADMSVLDENCICNTCKKKYTKASLHYLFKTSPSTASCILTHHNIVYMLQLSRAMRKAIMEKKFKPFVRNFMKEYYQTEGDGEVPPWCVEALQKAGISLQD